MLDPSPLKVLRWSRRGAKTFTITASDLHFAATHPCTKTIAVMPKFTQTKEIYFQGESGIQAHISRMDEKIREALILDNMQTMTRLTNGSVIMAEVANADTIRGHGPHRISWDEVNFTPNDDDLWLSALLPMMATRIVYVNAASTPWNKDSIYYKMCYDKSFRDFSGNVYHDIPGYNPLKPSGKPRYLRIWSDLLEPNGPLNPKQIEMIKEQYANDPWRWAREMECQFIDDGTAYIPMALITACQNDEEFALFEQNLQGAFVISWDLGREQDYPVVAVLQIIDDVVKLVHLKRFALGTPYVEQMAYIKSICARWQDVVLTIYDHTGTKGMDEEISRQGFPNLCYVDFSKPLKHSMASTLKQLMMTPRRVDVKKLPKDQKRRFEMPLNQEVYAEFNLIQFEQTEGSEIYTFTTPEGSHDDIFWTCAMGAYACMKVYPENPIHPKTGLIRYGKNK